MTFSESYRARWIDMDFNQHMRNAAFLGVGEETRMRFMDAKGWTVAQFQQRKLGPVAVEDRLTYKRELKLLEAFRVDVQVAATTPDARKMKIRNRFFLEADGTLCATVESVVLWFDLALRKPVVPPEELQRLWLELERTEAFEWFGPHPTGA